MLQNANNFKIINSENDLLEIFVSGIKSDKKIGVECEKLLVNLNNKKPATYDQVSLLLKEFDNKSYFPRYENDNLLGLLNKNGNISLEPGSQIEFSTIPFNNINELKYSLNEYLTTLKNIANKHNIQVLDLGALPDTTWQDIKIIPKSRYQAMTKYLPKKNLEPFRMMRETAGIQVNLDYSSEEDAITKLSLSLKLSPIVSGMYANSPYRQGKLNGLKSNRAYSWLNVDEQRCGFISYNLLSRNNDFSFNDYKNILLDIPMIFISRDNKTYYCENTFRNFLNNGYMNLEPTLEDWNTHLSLFFPEVRLKNHLEIRNHDNQKEDIMLTIPTLWKGLLYFDDSIEETNNILKRFDINDYIELRYKTPIFGLNYKIKGIWLKDFVQELISISKYNLSDSEKCYIEPIEELASQGLTPADLILKNQLVKI